MNKIIILLVILFSGCQSNLKDKNLVLDKAERLIHEFPDSALCLLDKINPENLVEAEQARYTLLITEARYGCKKYFVIDSNIQKASTFFDINGDIERYIRTLYMLAMNQFHNQDYPEAIVTALRAKEYAHCTNDKKNLARISELMSDISNYTYHCEDELEYASEACIYYKAAGLEKNYQYAVISKTRALHNLGKDSVGLMLIDSIIPHILSSDSLLMSLTLETRSRINLSIGRIHDAITDIEAAKNYYVSHSWPTSIILSFDISLAKGDYHNAKIYLDSIQKMPSGFFMSHEIPISTYRYYKATGDINKATEYLENIIDIQNGIVRKVLSESIVKAQAEFYQSVSRQAVIQSENNKKRLIGISILCGFVILSILMYYRIQQQKKLIVMSNMTQHIMELSSNLTDLSNTIHETQNTLDETRRLTAQLYRDKFDSLNKLCSEYIAKKDASEKIRLTLYKDIERQIFSLASTKKLDEINTSLDKYCDNIATRFRESFPSMKRADLTFVTLIFAGLSSKIICLICDITIGNYYTKRQRLKSLIENSDTPWKQQFLDHF